MNTSKFSFLLFKLLIVSSLCLLSCEQEIEAPFPFSPQEFKEVDPELTQHLLIPFLEDGKYGLADYEGNIKLEPQFSNLEMINLAYSFFWAGEKKAMTLHDLKGKEVLDYLDRPIKKSMIRFEQLEWYDENVPNYNLLLRILENEEEAKKDSKEARYYYLNKFTKQPFQTYKLPNYDHLKKYDSKNRLENFKSDNGIDSNIKVMTEDGRFTFLDKNGNELIAPNFNCYLLTDDKMILYREDKTAALKDLKNGWQTDFLFQKIRKTPHPDIFEAEFFNLTDRTTTKFIIGKKGKVTQLDVTKGERLIKANEKYSLRAIGDGKNQFKINFSLWDNNTLTKVKDLPTGNLYNLFDTYGVDFSSDRNEKRYVTFEGDTLLKPIFPTYVNMTESIYKFKNENIFGIADKDGNVLLEIVASQMNYRTDKTIALRKDRKYGWANSKGEIILPIEYDMIEYYENVERVIVRKNEKAGLFDLDGNEILPIVYRSINPEAVTLGHGLGFRVKYKESSYVISPDLEIFLERNNDTRIIKKSDFTLSTDSEAIKKDFEWAPNNSIHSNYSIYVGKTHTHIFRSDKKHIASIEGRSETYENTVYVGKTSNVEDGLRLSGLLELKRNEQKVWIRLSDGFVFEKK